MGKSPLDALALRSHAGYLAFPKKVTAREGIEVTYEEGRRVADDHPIFGVLASFWVFRS